MKTRIQLLTALLMTLGLTACGGGDTGTGGSDNHAPTISSLPDITREEDFTPAQSITLNGSDVDGDPLSYSVTSSNTALLDLSVSGNTLTLTPKANANGSTTLTVTVEDGHGGSASTSFDVTLTSVNDAPAISGTPATKITAESSYSFTPAANDTDGDTLHFSIVNKPSWANFDENTGRLSGTPDNSHVGTTTGIVISVSDGNATARLEAFDLEVIFYLSPCGNEEDNGYSAAEDITGKSVSGNGENAHMRVWHLADGTKKACLLSGSINVE